MKMKMSSKLFFVGCIGLLLIIFLLHIIQTKEEKGIFHNKNLVENVYACWEIQEAYPPKEGAPATVLLPELICEDPNLFDGQRFYFRLTNLGSKTRKDIFLVVQSEGEMALSFFNAGYEIPKSPGDIIRYNWGNLRYGYLNSTKERLLEEEKEIQQKSEQILKLAEEKFSKSLAVYYERKKQESEFLWASQGLGPKLFQAEELLNKFLWPLRVSTSIKRDYYSFEVKSSEFEAVKCVFLYDPDPDFMLTRIELSKSPGQKYFDLGYKIDYHFSQNDRVYGFINNEDATLESFNLLSDALKLIEEKVAEDPNIVRAAVLDKSVR